MIPNQWYAIEEAKKLGRTKPIGVTRLGKRLVLWRDEDGKVACADDRCAHRGVALSLGKVVNGRAQCAYHGFQYDRSGNCVKMPCAGEEGKIPKGMAVPTHVVQEDMGLIWYWYGEARDTYPPLPWFDEIPREADAGRTTTEAWPFNYVRCVENHLDVHHWAFVHRNIMMGVGASFNDMQVDVEDDDTLIKTYGHLSRDYMPGLDTKKGWGFKAYMRFPNLSLIEVTPRFRSIIIQTPMDDETTWILVRSVQSYSKIFPFGWMIDLYCAKFLFSVPLHRQDFPLFHEQRPRRSGVGVNKLVAADKGLAKYLVIRERLIKQAIADGFPYKVATEIAADGSPAAANGRLPIVDQVGSLVPAAARNLTVGAETPRGKLWHWIRACAVFPLLVPSLLSTSVFDRIRRA